MNDRLRLILTVLYAFLLLAMIFFASPVVIALLGVMLVIETTNRWGVRGGLLSAVWSLGLVVHGVVHEPESSIYPWLFGSVAYFMVLILIVEKMRISSEAYKLSEERYSLLFNRMVSGFVHYQIIYDTDGSPKDYLFLDVNPAFERISKLKKNDVVGKSIYQLVEKPTQEFMDFLTKIANTGEPAYSGGYYKNLDIYYEITGYSLGNGQIAFTFNDVTDTKRAEEALKRSDERFRQLFEDVPDGVYQSTPEGDFIVINPSLVEILGYDSVEDLMRINIKDLYADPDERETFLKRLAREGELRNVELRLIRKDGEEITVLENSRLVEDSDNGTQYYQGTITDITERKQVEEQLKHLSFHDALTDLYNRGYFEEEVLRVDVERQMPISIIMGDANGLKLVNDAFGHHEGDKLLVKMADIMKNSCRAEDVIARWGGDEFIMLLPQTKTEVASRICDRIMKSCAESDNDPIKPSISLGYATKELLDESMQQVIGRAESMMYNKKLVESRNIRNIIIESLRDTLDERTHESKDHIIRLQRLSTDIAKELNLASTAMDEIALLAVLHDIGKVGIPDKILSKKDSLSQEEWETVKRHSEIGKRIALSSIELTNIAESILTHHERWDGKGYPLGLSGEDIPLASRIVSIADAYDVMTHDRPYKKAMSIDEALEEINECSGSQFDPKLVEAIVEVILRQKKINAG